MTTTRRSVRVDHERLEQALRRADALTGAAEGHGALCGLICAQGRADRAAWQAQVMGEREPGDVLAREAESLLEALYEQTVEQLNDTALGFRLLLPDDDQPLGRRAEALGRWCQGFLFGLGLGGIRAERELPEDVREILRDLAEISRVEFDVEGAGEAEESAYAEIVEYVRVGVLLINEEMHPLKAPPRLM